MPWYRKAVLNNIYGTFAKKWLMDGLSRVKAWGSECLVIMILFMLGEARVSIVTNDPHRPVARGLNNRPPQLGNCGPPGSCLVALYAAAAIINDIHS